MNSSAIVACCDDIIKRLREAIAWLRAQQHIFDSHPKTATDKTPGGIADNIAALLDERDALREALEKLARLGNGDRYGNSDGNMIARAALENTDV